MSTTQSVCGHCGEPIIKCWLGHDSAFCNGFLHRDNYHACQNGNGTTRAEPASTGELPPEVCPKCRIGQLQSARREGINTIYYLCNVCSYERAARPSGPSTQEVSRPSCHACGNPMTVKEWGCGECGATTGCYGPAGFEGIPNGIANTVSGPEPSAPETTHCQECHEVITFNGSFNQWFHADGTSTYPKCTRPKAAPQTSAEPYESPVQMGIQVEARPLEEPPQPVAGDAPKVENSKQGEDISNEINLNGRKAHRFSLVVSERQFYISEYVDGKEVLIALSSSVSTLLKALDQIFKIATGQDFEFMLRSSEKEINLNEQHWTGCPEGKVEEVARKIAEMIANDVCNLTWQRINYFVPLIAAILRPYFPPDGTKVEGVWLLECDWHDGQGFQPFGECFYDSAEEANAARLNFNIPKDYRAVKYGPYFHRASQNVCEYGCSGGQVDTRCKIHLPKVLDGYIGTLPGIPPALATPASTARTDGWVSVEDGLPELDKEVVIEVLGANGKDVHRSFAKRRKDSLWDGYYRAYTPMEVKRWHLAPGSVPQAPQGDNVLQDGPVNNLHQALAKAYEWNEARRVPQAQPKDAVRDQYGFGTTPEFTSWEQWGKDEIKIGECVGGSAIGAKAEQGIEGTQPLSPIKPTLSNEHSPITPAGAAQPGDDKPGGAE